jgi:DNA-binding transcriptional LysR family regulator
MLAANQQHRNSQSGNGAAAGQPRHPRELAGHAAVIYARRDEASNTRWTFTQGDETIDVDVPVRVITRDGVGLVDAALSGAVVARPLDIAARHLLDAGTLKEILEDWTGDKLAISAVLPPGGRSAAAKVRLYVEYVNGLLR